MLVFTRPLFLLFLAPFLYFLWHLQKKGLTGATSRTRHFWLAIRSAVVVLIFLALSGLQWETNVHRNETLFLMDVSESVTRQQRKIEIETLNRVMEKIHSPDLAGIILFGENAGIERFPSHPFPVESLQTSIRGQATNLESAARLAGATFSANAQKNLIVLSDGEDNQGDPEVEFRLLKSSGVSLQSFYIPRENHVEAAIGSVRFPDDVHLNQPFEIEVLTESNHRMPAELQIFRNGSLLQEASIELPASGKKLFHLPQKLEERGLYHYEIRLKPEQDFRAENNFENGWVSVEGPPRVLLVDSEPSNLQNLRSLLERRGFSVDVKGAENFPGTIEDLLLYQAVLMRNIPAASIHDEMPLVQKYVRDFGGGFGMLGAQQSFGPGGYYKTPIEAVLPVSMDLRNKKYLADVAMAIVIDKSGSMSFTDRGKQKIDLADEGAARVASFLKKTDQLGVVAVDSAPRWVYPLQQLNDAESAIEAITSIRAGGGGIYVYSGLREAYAELRKSKAPVKHVILFADTADCEEKEGPSGESSFLLADRELKDNHITTTTIGIGQTGDGDVEFLRQLAGVGEGRFYFTSDMFTLPEIFAEESSIVQRYYINEEPFTPRLVQQVPLLPGIDAVPNLNGYVATSAKNLATVNLISQRQDPVLACWQYGLGRSVAFTSDPSSTWSASWKAWPELERFWSQMTRYLIQGGMTPHFRASVSAENGTASIVLEAMDEEGNSIRNGEFVGSFIDAGGNSIRVNFQQTAPGRYEANVSPSGTAIGKIVRMENGEIREQSLLQIPGNQGLEFRTLHSGRARLEQLTGKVLRSVDEIHFGSKPSRELQPLQKQLLLFAAFLFLLDVAMRKFDWQYLRRSRVETIAMESPQLGRLKARKKTINQLVRQESITIPENIESKELESLPPEETSDYMQRLKDAKRRSKQ